MESYAIWAENSAFTFQGINHRILKEAINIFVLAYMDDICIFSPIEKENLIYTKWVLKILPKAGLRINIKKCEFLKKKTNSLDLS